jgi:transposase
MNHDQIRAIILANPTEPPTSIAERIDVPAWRVKDARKGLIHIGAVVRLAKFNGPITDVDTAAIIEMRRAGHSITAIKDHFRRSYSVVFRIIAAATRAGQIEPAQRIVPIKPAQAAKVRTVIGDDERAEIIAMRRAGMTQPQIRERTGRSLGSIFDVLQAAIKAGELQPIKRMRRQERETCRGGLGDMPTPKVRLSLNMTEAERRAVASLSRFQRGTPQELLASVRNVQSQKRLHKPRLEPWEGAGPFHF